MKKSRSIATVLAATGILCLAGCVSATQYATMAEALNGSPALRRDAVDQCVRSHRSTAQHKDFLRKLMNLKPGSPVVRISCERAVKAVASGRLTYADYQNNLRGQTSPKVVRVLQGR